MCDLTQHFHLKSSPFLFFLRTFSGLCILRIRIGTRFHSGRPPFNKSTSISIRLAIIETDKPLPGIAAVCGDFSTIFTSLFQAACQSLDQDPQTLEPQIVLSIHNVLDEDPGTAYPNPQTLHAVFITWSRYSAYDNQDWILHLAEYTRHLLGAGTVQVIRICFGQQIAGYALGTKVAPSLK